MTTATPAPLYIGTKTVHASPMTRAAYNDYRGWKLPENENGDDAGFLVMASDPADHAQLIEDCEHRSERLDDWSVNFIEALRITVWKG